MRRKRVMRELVTIQEASKSPDGVGQRRKTWVDVDDMVELPAHVEYIGGSETFRGSRVEADVDVVFEMRQCNISPLHRLVHVNDGDKVYGIVAVRPAEGRLEGGFRRVLIFCKAVTNG